MFLLLSGVEDRHECRRALTERLSRQPTNEDAAAAAEKRINEW
jgi:hypothetical protein